MSTNFKKESLFNNELREINFYNDEESMAYKPVTEKNVNDALFYIYRDSLKKGIDSMTTENIVTSVVNNYQEIVMLSHESSLNNDGVTAKSEIIKFLVHENRLMTDEELKTRDDYVERADELIGEKMVPLMDSLNEVFEKYDMECRFVDLDDKAVVREQALEIEESRIEKRLGDKFIFKNKNGVETQIIESKIIANTGSEMKAKAEENIERYISKNNAHNRSKIGVYMAAQDKLIQECKENDVDLESMRNFKNPNFASNEDDKTVWKDKDDGLDF